MPTWTQTETTTTLSYNGREFGHVKAIGHPENIYTKWLVKGDGWSAYKKSRVIAEEFLAQAFVSAHPEAV